MTIKDIYKQIDKKKSFLCVGLDSDIDKIPKHLLKLDDPVFEFNKQIIDATHDLSISYKPNTAFYECRGAKGWKSLEKTANYIKQNYPEIFLIADAKRGDIGNTSKMYAKTFFENMPFDAVTVAPYMGSDSVQPFLNFTDKFVILLALTSNTGGNDFQFSKHDNNKSLFHNIIEKSKEWGGTPDNMMYVVGATKSEYMDDVRKLIPDNFLLVPGIGSQGGKLQQTINYGKNKYGGLIINSSRGIIFADNSVDFAQHSRNAAAQLQKEMSIYFD